MVDTDEMIRVSCKESGSVGRPSQAKACGSLARFGFFRTKSVHNNLALQVPNLDTVIRGSTEPVTVGRKDERVNNLTSIQGVETLAFVQVLQGNANRY